MSLPREWSSFLFRLIISFLHLVFYCTFKATMCVFVSGEGGFSISLTLFPMRLSVFMWTQRNKFLAWICAPLFLAFDLSTLLMAFFWWVFILSLLANVSIPHLQALFLFLTTFCLQWYYEDTLSQCLLDDYHLTLHVCRNGIMSYFFLCMPRPWVHKNIHPPHYSVATAVNTLSCISVWTLVLLVYFTYMCLAHITLI